MLKILIVEDDAQLATTLKYLVEDNPRYRVVARVDDLDGAVAAASEHNPDLALVDLHLARGSTGFSVAVRLGDFDIPCLFVTGKAPAFPMPDLALGCLLKPFTAEDVHRTLAMAEDVMRGRETLRPKLPPNLLIYDGMDQPAEAQGEPGVPGEPGFIPSRRSLKTRLEHWIAGTQAHHG
ncbi:MAG TPA: response regulator [Sphingomicrobium sp.]|nr:response regulator [Sphingomicrobium sp.]